MSQDALALIERLRTVVHSRPYLRARIAELQAWSERLIAEQPAVAGMAQMPVRHQFADHCYIRTVTIPKGLLVVGKIHRHTHLNFISRGDVTFVTECEGVQRVQGPHTMISPAGTKRALYTHEETVWTTVHVTEETDLAMIEAEVIAPDYDTLGWDEPAGCLPHGASAGLLASAGGDG